MNLRDYFFEAAASHGAVPGVIASLWDEIRTAYDAPGRYYHNLTHLENMLEQLLSARSLIREWDIVLFALCYHDFVYEALQGNNEAESAAVAETHLKMLGLDKRKTDAVSAMIMATKKHELCDQEDINLFTDADLSILGAGKEIYCQYAAAIREEYAAVPDMLYMPGRKKVLQHFLDMEHIFKTPVFREQLEARARINLQEELNNL